MKKKQSPKFRYFSFFVLIIIIICSVMFVLYLIRLNDVEDTTVKNQIPEYSFSTINIFPHDTDSFTQGLIFFDDFMYEGTGQYGKSSLRKVDLVNGNISNQFNLSIDYFGEGITIFENIIYQLTWKEQICFVYDLNFTWINSFNYSYDGWGITHDNSNLITSDGTSTIHFHDPMTFDEIKTITVHDGNNLVTNLNELEYINGEIYANIWQTNRIVIFSPDDGNVTGWINLDGIKAQLETYDTIDVLNGIAYDTVENRLFITGKLWPNIFEIELVEIE